LLGPAAAQHQSRPCRRIASPSDTLDAASAGGYEVGNDAEKPRKRARGDNAEHGHHGGDVGYAMMDSVIRRLMADVVERQIRVDSGNLFASGEINL